MGLGCLGVLVLGCLFIGGLTFAVTVMIRRADAYQVALSTAQRSPAVIAALGAPVKAGWWTTGQVEVMGTTGIADLEIPISGPRGSAKVEVHAHRTASKWNFSALNVRVPGRATPIDLLATSTP